MGAVAEGEARRIVDRGLLQPRLERLERKVVRHIGGAGDLRERDAAVGAGDDERAVGELDVARRPPPADARRSACPWRRSCRRRDRAREPPTAIEREPNVPVPYGTASVSPSLDLDVLDRDAELRRQDLRVGGGVALAVIVGAEHGAAPRRRARPGSRPPRRSRRARRARPRSATARRPTIRRSRRCRCRAAGPRARPRRRRCAKPS